MFSQQDAHCACQRNLPQNAQGLGTVRVLTTNDLFRKIQCWKCRHDATALKSNWLRGLCFFLLQWSRTESGLNDTLRHLGANSFSRLPSTLLKSLRAIQAYAGAVKEIGDRDADAARDDETASAVKHQTVLDNPERLQAELPKPFWRTSTATENEQHAQNEKAEPEEYEQEKEQEEQKRNEGLGNGQEKEQEQEEDEKQDQVRTQENVKNKSRGL